MKTTIFRRLATTFQDLAPGPRASLTNTPREPGRLSGQRGAKRHPQEGNSFNGFLVIATLLLAAGNATAQTVLTTLAGYPAGYVDGGTHDFALFSTPIGLALNSSGSFLYVADRDNNAIRLLNDGPNFSGGQTFTFATNGIRKPVGVALDPGDNVYVLNRGNGTNGTVLEFDSFQDVFLIATNLVNASGMALDALTNIYVTVRSNAIIQITPSGSITTVATITSSTSPLATNTLLQGITVTASGLLAVSDAGNNGIWLVNPLSGAVTNLTGFNGPGDHFGPKSVAQFTQPYGISAAGGGTLVVADYGNHRVKVVDSLGTVTNLYGVNSSFWVTGPGTF